jgi:heme/copper-type cytochrome/quinol oxidase subunit 2
MSIRPVLALVLLVPLATMADATPRQASPRRVIELTAERFEFWPPQITLQEGEAVDIRIRSDDTAHGFRIVGTSTSVTVPKRGQGMVVATFTAGKAGRYIFECNRMCGAGHNFMRGEIVVRGPAAAGGRR